MRRMALAATALVCIVLTNCSRADLYDGLVAYFPFDGNLEEVTGLSNDGINHGSTDTADRFGVAGRARHFTGGQYITVPRSATIEPADAVTVALWARLTDPLYPNQLTIICKRYNVDAPLYNSYWLQPTINPDNGDFNIIGATIPGGTSTHLITSTVLQPDVWTHLALTYDGSSLRIYQDGQLGAERPATGTLWYSSDNLYIGMATPARTECHWEGDIDDVRIYNRALSAGEIGELSVVPVPGAVLLGSIGLVFAGRRLRRE